MAYRKVQIDRQNSNRYCIVVKEGLEKTAYCFSVPIYNSSSGKLINLSFTETEQGYVYHGTAAVVKIINNRCIFEDSNIFLQYISYSTVKQKIFYELIDAQLYIFLSNASSQGDVYMTRYWLNLINDEEYHFNEIKSKYSDTYNFLMSLNDRLPTIKDYP